MEAAQMTREIAVPTYIYMEMQDGETKEAAIERMCKALWEAGLTFLDFDDDDVRIDEY